MFAILSPVVASVSLAHFQAARIPFDPPTGRERLSISLPKGFFTVHRIQGRLVLSNQHAQIIVDWTPGRITEPLRKAMAESFKNEQKKGAVMGSLQIGPYQGPLLKIVFNQGKLGIDLHAPLVSGHNLLGITYYDPKADVHTTQRAAQLLFQFAKNSRFTKG